MGFWQRLFGAGADAADSPLDPHHLFLAQFEGYLKEQPEVSAIERLSEGFGFRCKWAGSDHVLHLGATFEETRELSPEEREAQLRRFLEGTRPDQVDATRWEDIRDRLMPVLRAPMVGFDARAAPEAGLLAREVLPMLRELVVIDLPDSMSYVMRPSLRAWAVSEEEVFAVARANLARRLEPGLTLYDSAPSPIWHVDAGDDYESSRLLHPELLGALEGRIEGRPVVIIPDRSQLLIAGDADPATVERLCEMAEREYAESPRSISMGLYTFGEAGGLVPYLREGGDALAKRVREAHVQFIGTEYSQQQPVLEKELEEAGVDLFVASFSGIKRRAEDPLTSYCSWALGVEGLLPETDLVVLSFEDASPPLAVTWTDALRMAPHHLTREPGIYPPRFRTAPNVPAEVTARLRSAAHPL